MINFRILIAAFGNMIGKYKPYVFKLKISTLRLPTYRDFHPYIGAHTLALRDWF